MRATYLLILLCVFCAGCGHKPVHIPTAAVAPAPRPLQNVQIALVLGGGGARGIAHAGVLSVLEENNIPIDLIVGTSAGSIVGALYADHPDSGALKHQLIKLTKWDVLDFNITSGMKMLWQVSGFVDGHALKGFLKRHIRAYHFDELKIPLAVVTTDIENGSPYVIRSGAIIPAIHASSAIPMIFTPVNLYGKTLVDGGVVSPVPVEVARNLGAKHVIAVDIGDVIEPTKVKGMYELADRCLWLSYYALSQWQNQQADILIQPKFHYSGLFDDSKAEEYYQLGRNAALEALPALKSKLQG